MDYDASLPVPDAQDEDLSLQSEASNSLLNAQDSDYAQRVYAVLLKNAVYPLCVLGSLGNVVVLWVWSAESAYHPTTYLFKALAVSDILALVSLIIVHLVPGLFFKSTLFYGLAHGNRKVGVQITMLLAVVRVIRVFLPLRSDQLLSSTRIKVVLAGFTLWSLSEQMLENYLRVSNSVFYSKVDRFAGDILSLIVPSALQIICMTAVTWRLWRSVRVGSSSHRPAGSLGHETLKAQQLVYSVFVICVFTFIAYFVGYSVITFVVKCQSKEDKTILPNRLIFYISFSLACVINSSVNIIIYYFFIGKFKLLLFKKLIASRQIIMAPFFISSSATISSRRTSRTQTLHPDGDKIVTHETAAEDATNSKLPACALGETPAGANSPSSPAPKGPA